MDDEFALKEFHRVLKNQGRIILQTPYSSKIKKSIQYENVLTDEDRFEKYGQGDHVRIYGKDLFNKIEKNGFKSDIYNNDECFSNELSEAFGVNAKEEFMMFICEK